ncbi:hypothetical protein LCGC14_0836890 [marine sediment metagenome]|uniref:Uncharacterized protein n=1 Tax=marine sediment metagenome TaxID=412755 RepID=A0A0F9RYZ8_9ZZZZ
MSTLGMFGKVAEGYLKAAEANRDKQSAAEKEQRQVATSIFMRLMDDPSTRPETKRWALQGLTDIAGGKFKKVDISQIPTGEADPGQPPELGQMAAPAGQPQPQQRQMPTPPPPTGEQYLAPMSPEEQARLQAPAIEMEAFAKRRGGLLAESEFPSPPQGTLARQQVVDPDNPDKPKLVLINTRSGEAFDAETMQPWTGPMTPWVAPRKETLGEQYVAELMKGGMSLVEAVDKYNTRFSTSTGFRLVEQPDGTLALVPITTQRITGRGKPRIPSPPGEPTAPRIVGGKTTSAARTRSEIAGSLLTHLDPILKQVDSLEAAGRLGPIMGRWNDFMVGTIGAGDPEYTELRTNIGLLQTGLMMAHVGARGGVKLLEKFTDLVNAQKMDAATLRGTLKAVEGWLRTYEQIPERQMEKMRRKQGLLPPSATAAGPIEVDDIVMYQGKPHRVIAITNGKAELEPLD